jgi:hypothetical protein
MSSNQMNRERKQERLSRRTDEIEALEQHGYTVRALTEYQFRINEQLDVYPTRKRFHHIKTQKRGSYTSLLDLVEKTVTLL